MVDYYTMRLTDLYESRIAEIVSDEPFTSRALRLRRHD